MAKCEYEGIFRTDVGPCFTRILKYALRFSVDGKSLNGKRTDTFLYYFFYGFFAYCA